LHDPKLEKLDGDAFYRDMITRALVGVDAVIQTLVCVAFAGPDLTGTRLFSTATRVLVNSMGAGTVKRLLWVTGFGAGDS
jgi:putative NADH-flavin reductase